MFSLPVPSQDSQGLVDGSSDEKPIMLYGDRVEAFKSLLHILYAL